MIDGKPNAMHPLYVTWRDIRKRCRCAGYKGYRTYGKRGISVCKRWDDFAKFVADLGTRPEGMTIDRIDNDGDYEPSNCRWATPAQQSRNTSRLKLSPRVVRQIRSTTGVDTAKRIAKATGASVAYIFNVRCGINWSGVSDG